MAYEFKFPDVGEGITEGTIVSWKVKEGDKVENDQVLAEVETDKAVVDIPSPQAGTILKLQHKEGDVIQVGEVLAWIGKKGEKVEVKEEKKEGERYTGSVVGFLPEAEGVEPTQQGKKAPARTGVKIAASPKARKLSKELGVDLTAVTGTGPAGRITEEDVEKASKGGAKKVEVHGEVERIPMKGIRKLTAQKMREAMEHTAMLTHHDDVDVTELNTVRKVEKEIAAKENVHMTFMPFIMKAVINAIKAHPIVASSIEGSEIIIKKYYNIGVAMDTGGGLLVPVVRDADKKSLIEIARDIQGYVEQAKDRKVSLEDMKGGVFTITNIGVLDTSYFTPIVNFPETCILGTGRIEDKPWVVSGKVVVRKILPLSFTYDHQVLDGAEAAKFIGEIKDALEDPKSLL